MKMLYQEHCGREQADLWGLELEVEGAPQMPLQGMLQRWDYAEDASLHGKNGHELVSAPLSLGVILKDYKEIFKHYTTFKKETRSRRASTHVHVNIGDLTKEQYVRMVQGYLVLEPLFYQLSRHSRITNNFCMPLRDAHHILTAIARYAKKSSGLLSVAPKSLTKYYGLNVLTGYGTLEFRHMDELPNPETLETFMKAIYALKNHAKSTTGNIALDTSGGAQELTSKVFPGKSLSPKELEKALDIFNLMEYTECGKEVGEHEEDVDAVIQRLVAGKISAADVETILPDMTIAQHTRVKKTILQKNGITYTGIMELF